MSETMLAGLAFTIFWPLVIVAILIAGQRWQSARIFKEKMIAQWKPSLAIALVSLISMGLSTGFLNPFVIAIFCQALIGLAVARSIADFEPLTITRSLFRRERIWRSLALMFLIALGAALVGFLVGVVGAMVTATIFHEIPSTKETTGILPFSVWQGFFYFLWGAGISEETTYRLVILSFIWRWTRRSWVAIVLSAIMFSAYHLTPLSGYYRTFWQFPISQLTASALIGLVWGYTYVKRGYETAVLAHTLQDSLPLIAFALSRVA